MNTKNLFSQRYKALIDNSACKNQNVNYFLDISIDLKKKLCNIMEKFNEPCQKTIRRYDSYTISTDVITLSIREIDEILGFSCLGCEKITNNCNFVFNEFSNPLFDMKIYYLFDLIEFQFKNLSEYEKSSFRNELNSTFLDFGSPWILLDTGRLIKIDSSQFEKDLKNKMINDLFLLKSNDNRFKSAYDELLGAIEFLNNEKYSEAINNAEKAYESVLKLLCNENKGSAKNLIECFFEKYNTSLPENMKLNGFLDKVFGSLPYIRNNSDSAHGAGLNNNKPNKELANLAINLSCSLISYVLSVYKSNQQKDKKRINTL